MYIGESQTTQNEKLKTLHKNKSHPHALKSSIEIKKRSAWGI